MQRIKTYAMLGAVAMLMVTTACSSGTPSAASETSTEATPAASGSGSVSVNLNQWSVVPSTTNVAAGPVTFDVANQGTIPHEFVVLRTKTEASDIAVGKFEREPDRINEDTSGTNVGETGDLNPGASKSVTLDLQPGHYVFLCNLPAHYQSGMHVDVTVA
ncbi:MAG: cupredoxin domain-containing protein [Actinomycetota bacterium]